MEGGREKIEVRRELRGYGKFEEGRKGRGKHELRGSIYWGGDSPLNTPTITYPPRSKLKTLHRTPVLKSYEVHCNCIAEYSGLHM